jgi:hypothetical protein
MKKIRSLKGINDPYSRRILGHVLNRDAVKILRSTPVKLRRLLKGLTGKQLNRAPVKGKWTITQLICHLTDTELVLSFRLRMAIAESGKPLQAIDEKLWAKRLGYPAGDVRERLALLTLLRKENVRLLRSLAPASWERFGMHEERGKETVARMAQMYAGHDVNHVAQILSIRRSLLKGGR